MMIEYRCAYRLGNEIEGFLGFGFTEEAAVNDALIQIRRKLEILADLGRPLEFNLTGVIESFDGLTPEEHEAIQHDWKCNVRY